MLALTPLIFVVLPARADTLAFQAGVGEFGRTEDITIVSNSTAPGAYANEPWLFADTSDGDHSNAEVRALLRFPDVVGPGDGQIRRGSQIHSATLTLRVDNAGGELGIHEVLEAWTLDEVSWRQRSEADGAWEGAGVDPPSASTKALMSHESTTVGAVAFSVRIAVGEWVRNPALNHGLVLIPESSDGTDIHSSESEEVDLRPLLVVDYTPSEGDTGLVADTGAGADSATPSPDDSATPTHTPHTTPSTGTSKDAGCGCAATGGAVGGWLVVAGMLASLRRRRPS